DARGLTTYRVVVVTAPVADPTKTLLEILREPGVRARIVNDTVILEGSVKTEADKARAEGIASAFGKRVVSLLTVEQPTPPPPPATKVLEEQLREALKDLPVIAKVIREDTVLVEGTVATESELKRIEAIVKAFAKNVVLLVRIRSPIQVRVDAFVAEVDRQALRQMGVEWGGGNISELLTDPFAFHFGNLGQDWPLTPLQLLIARLQLLEGRGAARTLANPRVVVLEGRPAKLLIGGEVPIPVLTPTGLSVAFKEFGVRLEFKAIVEAGEPMTLDLKTEVSSLDFTNAIVAAGITIPTIRSRRVETVVSMRPEEFLVLGGLIQRDESQTVQKVPILGDIPILGALFRSVRFQRGETELVIFVSPSVVEPVKERPELPGTQPAAP
ncbi:MAG: BON domain-containing protein, partial [Armatimonadota bacterium]|nr:BON domain-containing protein [Armatimonadota bacterium]